MKPAPRKRAALARIAAENCVLTRNCVWHSAIQWPALCDLHSVGDTEAGLHETGQADLVSSKPMAEYAIWVIDEPDSNFGLFIDRTTGEWFVTDSG